MRRAMLAGLLMLGGVCSYAPEANADPMADTIAGAITKGVEYLRTRQEPSGAWPRHNESGGIDPRLGPSMFQLGPTSLAGLTLLECDVPADDPGVVKAAAFVRENAPKNNTTYDLSLSILFLDRLGDPEDTPLIESLSLRIVAGQLPSGGWDYGCPPTPEGELERLKNRPRQSRQLKGGRDLLQPDQRRRVRDLSPEIRAQLSMLPPGGVGGGTGDNSNTQFATLAIWVAGRYGLPVDAAAARIEARFRRSQARDYGWGYHPGDPAKGSMTCAGVLGLAVAYGVGAIEGRGRAIAERDPQIVSGLAALASFLDPYPLPEQAPNMRDTGRGGAWGEDLGYFLWSLERTCVLLDVETLQGKDWYSWGSRILLHNQQPTGGWSGKYAVCGADTCFALLFLKRANLARDLTASLKNRKKDIERNLKAGGVGGKDLVTPERGQPPRRGRGTAVARRPRTEPKPTPPPEPVRPAAPSPAPTSDSSSARLAEELIKAPASERDAVLEKLQDGRGVEYTEALAAAIPRLHGEMHQKAREALEHRLARMKADTLGRYLQDEDVEIRRAAVVACGARELKNLVPQLIPLLRDASKDVATAAYSTLKDLTEQDLGMDMEAWQKWWDKHGKN